MNQLHLLTAPLFFIALSQSVRAQHCPPIWQSFLSEVSVKSVQSSLGVRVEYTKDGGSAKDAYQAYVISYLEKDAKQVPTPKGKDVLNPKAALVLHTQVIKPNAQGTYDLDYAIPKEVRVNRVIKHMGLGGRVRENQRSWPPWQEQIRIAVFIPMLDDKK
jgi:hypothetical protein